MKFAAEAPRCRVESTGDWPQPVIRGRVVYIVSCVSLGSLVAPTLWSVETASGPFKSVDGGLSHRGAVCVHGIGLAI